MSEKRKDKKGRILKDGESYRTDGRYMYRYVNLKGERHCIYARSLDDLREKEQQIQRDLQDGIDYSAGSITVIELVQKYVATKRGVKYNTKVGYNFVQNLMKKHDFCYKRIRDVKPSDAKTWLIQLHENGYKYSTLTTIRGVIKPAFDMAVEDDIVRRNPFAFPVVDVVANDTTNRKALTPKEKENLLSYLLEDKCRRRYYDEVVILLETGLRISELYGLTISDIDFQNSRIRVERQLVRTRHTGSCQYYIETPKTESGKRYVPMSPEAIQAFQNVIQNRKKPKSEIVVDGYSNFIFLDKDGKPKVAGHLEHAMTRIVRKYNDSHIDKLIVSPHVLRHTFCTEMVRSGMTIKELQYILGHADAYTTLNIYSHSDYETAKKSFENVLAKRAEPDTKIDTICP